MTSIAETSYVIGCFSYHSDNKFAISFVSGVGLNFGPQIKKKALIYKLRFAFQYSFLSFCYNLISTLLISLLLSFTMEASASSFVIFSGGSACNHILDSFQKTGANEVSYILGISDNGGSTVRSSLYSNSLSLNKVKIITTTICIE